MDWITRTDTTAAAVRKDIKDVDNKIKKVLTDFQELSDKIVQTFHLIQTTLTSRQQVQAANEVPDAPSKRELELRGPKRRKA